MMQTARYLPMNAVPLPGSPRQTPGDTLRGAVTQLVTLSRTVPCANSAQTFCKMVQQSLRFRLALDELLPLLSGDANTEITDRICVCFILFALYVPHPINMNPFLTVFYGIFLQETARAEKLEEKGLTANNDQYVYVLWKILVGEGKDLAAFSPEQIMQHPVPSELRAAAISQNAKTRLVFELTANGGGEVYLESEHKEDQEARERLTQGMNLLLAARQRVLTLAEQRALKPLIPILANSPMITTMDILPIISQNPSIATPLVISLLTSEDPSKNPLIVYDALINLPPTLTSFDIIGQLLRDQTTIVDDRGSFSMIMGDIIRSEVLGYFLHQCIEWLDNAEREERLGMISDDRFGMGVQNLCRFYHSLLKLYIINLDSDDMDTTEMAHFTLRHSRFEDANALYRILVTGRL